MPRINRWIFVNLHVCHLTLCHLLYSSNSGKEHILDASKLSVERWFGCNVELSRHVLQYIPADIRQLYSIAMMNKVLMESITVEIAVRCAMLEGGSSYENVTILQKLMRKRAIYPPSGLRILRICNGKRCEFCNNRQVNPFKTFAFHQHMNDTGFLASRGPFRLSSNPRPRRVRPSCGLFACQVCMTTARPPSISRSWPYPCITRRWDRVIYNRNTGIFYIKQYYAGNRDLMFRIFKHGRVLAYPAGYRLLSIHGVENERGETVHEHIPTRTWPFQTSQDRFEIVQSDYFRGAAGELIGSVANLRNIKELALYLKCSKYNDIDYFLDNLILEPPQEEAYTKFLDTYAQRHWYTSRLEQKKATGRKELRQLYSYNKMESTIHAISIVISCITTELVQRGLCSCRLRPNGVDRRIFQRMLLSYREEHVQRMHYRVTYSTGKSALDTDIRIWLRELLKSPTTIIRDETKARPIALKLVSSFGEKYGLPRKLQIRNVFTRGRVHAEFALDNFTGSHTYYNRHHNPRRHQVGPWRDRSTTRRHV